LDRFTWGEGALILGRAALLISLLIGPSALASHLDTPECQRDLAVAGQLVKGIAKREGSVKPGDIAGACALLQQNLPEMIKARNAMDRCLTGHDLGENVGQMDASIEDIRYALRRRCGLR
jgi:hypothetical protein